MRRSGRVLEYRSGFRSIRYFGSRSVRQCRGLDLPCRNLDYSQKKQSEFPILITRTYKVPDGFSGISFRLPSYVWFFALSYGGVSFSANLPPPASVPEIANAMHLATKGKRTVCRLSPNHRSLLDVNPNIPFLSFAVLPGVTISGSLHCTRLSR